MSSCWTLSTDCASRVTSRLELPAEPKYRRVKVVHSRRRWCEKSGLPGLLNFHRSRYRYDWSCLFTF